MTTLAKKVRSFFISEDGPTATEYAVMLALIVLISIAAITLLGNKVKAVFASLEGALPSSS